MSLHFLFMNNSDSYEGYNMVGWLEELTFRKDYYITTQISSKQNLNNSAGGFGSYATTNDRFHLKPTR